MTTLTWGDLVWVIGVDEAGRGPVIGPLIVGAFMAPAEDGTFLRELGVEDSKCLNKKQREQVAQKLRLHAQERGWQWTVVELSPDRIDAAVAVNGLNLLEAEGFGECIASLWTNEHPLELHLDACDVDAVRFGTRVGQALQALEHEADRIRSWHGADEESPHVAAASILAKTTRDAWMAKFSEAVGFQAGSGYPSDPATKKALPLLLQGATPHPDLRWSWATTKRAWEDLHGTKAPVRTERGVLQQTRLFDPPSS